MIETYIIMMTEFHYRGNCPAKFCRQRRDIFTELYEDSLSIAPFSSTICDSSRLRNYISFISHQLTDTQADGLLSVQQDPKLANNPSRLLKLIFSQQKGRRIVIIICNRISLIL